MRALLRTCELAHERVSKSWSRDGYSETYPKKVRPREYWWEYPACNDDQTIAIDVPRGWRPNWELFLDSAGLLIDGRPGVPAFVAGMSGQPGGIRSIAVDSRAQLQAAGFELLPFGERHSSKHEYVIKTRYVSELLKGDSLDHEAQQLASWVIDTFQELAKLVKRPKTARGRLRAGATDL